MDLALIIACQNQMFREEYLCLIKNRYEIGKLKQQLEHLSDYGSAGTRVFKRAHLFAKINYQIYLIVII